MSGAEPVRHDCPAKVNLFLEVAGKRPDGFHDLVTVFQAVALYDTLQAYPEAEGLRLEVRGADLPAGPGNLVFDAATLFLDRFPARGGVLLRLTKRIPVEAGMGGGSSDAAGTLLALRELFHPDLDVEVLRPLAAELGSDVPFFIDAGTQLGEGRGERLTPLPSPAPLWLVLHLPGFGLATRDVFGAVEVPPEGERRDPAALVEGLGHADAAALAGGLFNRLETAAERVEPRVREIREALAAPLGPGEAVLMTGSGSAFFAPAGSYARAEEIRKAWGAALPGRSLTVKTA